MQNDEFRFVLLEIRDNSYANKYRYIVYYYDKEESQIIVTD